MRGGDLSQMPLPFADLGPSPHARGRRAFCSVLSRAQRDHPRMRGGDESSRSTNQANGGPSPHARGRPASLFVALCVRGTIPACAGETLRKVYPQYLSRDHPRMRGGDDLFFIDIRHPKGPSPHARGRLRQSLCTLLPLRTIPACAGETFHRFLHWLIVGDHPRMRGGDFPEEAAAIEGEGPSPHARGRLIGEGWRSEHRGTIPACAGETGLCPVRTRRLRDHPRMRGGDFDIAAMDRMIMGPSPHARGRREQRLIPLVRYGTIPACAGETPDDNVICSGHRDHPRMRGGDCTRCRAG